MSEIIELVSDAVHANWMASKRAAGVESRRLESGEELMVPYADLSDAAKELDRGTVRTVLSVLPTLGYAIVRESHAASTSAERQRMRRAQRAR